MDLCCSSRRYSTGLTTGINYGELVAQEMMSLVVAHEIGHNFGAMHDSAEGATDPLCYPSGNRYLM